MASKAFKLPVPSKKVSEKENRGELMAIEPNEAQPSTQPLILKSCGASLASRGDSGLCDLIAMGNRVFSLTTLRGDLAISAQREPIIGSAFVVTSFLGQVIHPLVWRIRGGFVVSQAVMPFPTQLTRLNHLNVSEDN
ncbi:hypothetical protein AMTRI_Chr10g227870 [Amborella trichopoda]